MKITINVVTLLFLALGTASCALMSQPGGLKVSTEGQAKLGRELTGSTYYLAASMSSGAFFGQGDKLFADPRPAEIISLFNQEGKPLAPPRFEGAPLWAGMPVKVTRVLFPDDLADRPASYPTAHTWLELERQDEKGPPVVIVLPKDIATEVAFREQIADYLGSKAWVDSWLLQRSPTVLDGIYAKEIQEGMSRSEMFAAFGKPKNASRLSDTSILEHVAQYGDLLITLTGGMVSKIVSQRAVAEAARIAAEEEVKKREATEAIRLAAAEEKRQKEEAARKIREEEEARALAVKKAKEAEERRMREAEAARIAEIERVKKEEERKRVEAEQQKKREAEQARLEKERKAQEKLDKAAKAKQEKLDKAAKAKAEKERKAQEKLDEAARAKAEKERKAQEKLDRVAQAKRDKEERELAAREAAAKTQAEKDRLAQERAAREMAERERVEREAKDKAERDAAARAEAARRKLENTAAAPPSEEELQRAGAELDAKRGKIEKRMAKAESRIKKDESRNRRSVDKAQAYVEKIEKMRDAAVIKVQGPVGEAEIGVDEAREARPVPGSKGRKLGLTLEDVTPLLQKDLKLDGPDCAYVLDTRAAGVENGFEAGDVICKFNDVAIKDSTQLEAAAAEAPLDAPVYVEILRKGKVDVLILSEFGVVDEAAVAAAQARLDGAKAKVSETEALWRDEVSKARDKLRQAETALEKKLKPSRDELFAAQCELADLEGRPRPLPTVTHANRRKLGLRLGVASADLLRKNRLEAGALVVEVSPGGAGSAAGVRANDIISRFNGKPVKDARGLAGLAAAAPRDAAVPFQVMRNAHVVKLTLYPEGEAPPAAGPARERGPVGPARERGPVAPARGPVRRGPVVPKGK